MASIKLSAGLYFERLMQLSVSDGGSWAELGKALPGEPDASMGPIDPALFAVYVNDKPVTVLAVQMHKQATLVLSQPIPKGALVRVVYNAPEGNQPAGVLQTSSGTDIPSAELVSTKDMSFFQGFKTEVQAGAEYGIDFSREFPEVGTYLDASGSSTIDQGNSSTVIKVSGGKMTVELVATSFAANPAFVEGASLGLSSFSRTKGKLTVVLDSTGLAYKAGDVFDASQLGSSDRNIKVYSATQSVLATNDGATEKEFQLFSHTALGNAVPFWLAIGTWQFGANGVDFNKIEIGGTYDDLLLSGGGNDRLDGGGGNDTLFAGGGNDIVNGGTGNDLMIGGDGAGNDSYDGGKGIDTVKYTSAMAGITVDMAKGTASSSAGGDTAGIGTDKLKGIENLIAGNYADTLIGSKDANVIEGRSGNDTIDGGLGSDTLIGGAGADRFFFSTKPAANNIDTISDFEVGIDKLVLSAKIFAKLKGITDFTPYFAISTAADANDFLIYDPATGRLSYDADGSGKGKATEIAILVGAAGLVATDLTM